MILRMVAGFRWTKDKCRRLSGHQRSVIFYTVILPTAVMQPLLLLFPPPLPVVVAINLLWCTAAVTILGSAMNDDRTTTERIVDQKVDHLSDKVSQLRVDHKYAEEDHRQQVDDLEKFIRAALAELDIVLPRRPPIVTGIATGSTIHFSVSNAVGVSVSRNGSWKARFRSWMRSAWRRVWEVIYGKPVGD